MQANSGVTGKNAEPRIKIELKDIVLLGNELGFCCWCMLLKWLPIQTVEVAKNILVTFTASQRLHSQHEIPSCLQIISSPCWNSLNVRCRLWDTVVTEWYTSLFNKRLPGRSSWSISSFNVFLIEKKANGLTKSELSSLTNIIDIWLESMLWSSDYLKEKLCLLARI